MRPYLEVKFAPENTPVTGIALDKTTITATTGDEPMQLNKRFTPKYPSNTNVTWSSDNTKVATVSAVSYTHLDVYKRQT